MRENSRTKHHLPINTKASTRVWAWKIGQRLSCPLTAGRWRWSQHLNLSVFFTNQFDKHFVFKRVVLPVDVHRRVVCRCADFTGQLLLNSIFILHWEQVTVRGHAEVVFLKWQRVSERRSLDSHRASDWGEEPNFLAIDPDRLLLLTWRAAAVKETSSGSDLTGQTLTLASVPYQASIFYHGPDKSET